MIVIRNFSDRLRSPQRLYDRSRLSTALSATTLYFYPTFSCIAANMTNCATAIERESRMWYVACCQEHTNVYTEMMCLWSLDNLQSYQHHILHIVCNTATHCVPTITPGVVCDTAALWLLSSCHTAVLAESGKDNSLYSFWTQWHQSKFI